MHRPIQYRMQLVLQATDGCGEIHVELDEFLKFNLRFDWELDTLVARWSDHAAPMDRERNWGERLRP